MSYKLLIITDDFAAVWRLNGKGTALAHGLYDCSPCRLPSLFQTITDRARGGNCD
ncbi:hypothetical protein [Desulfovibrio sp.]|uniref:hypothetical protein n=1 Tax=Desulfovibrio sp. TaxID=885 RepID=UPI0035B31004